MLQVSITLIATGFGSGISNDSVLATYLPSERRSAPSNASPTPEPQTMDRQVLIQSLCASECIDYVSQLLAVWSGSGSCRWLACNGDCIRYLYGHLLTCCMLPNLQQHRQRNMPVLQLTARQRVPLSQYETHDWAHICGGVLACEGSHAEMAHADAFISLPCCRFM